MYITENICQKYKKKTAKFPLIRLTISEISPLLYELRGFLETFKARILFYFIPFPNSDTTEITLFNYSNLPGLM